MEIVIGLISLTVVILFIRMLIDGKVLDDLAEEVYLLKVNQKLDKLKKVTLKYAKVKKKPAKKAKK